MAFRGVPRSIIKQRKAIVTRSLRPSSKCKSKHMPTKKKKKSLLPHIPMLIGLLWGVRNSTTIEAEFRNRIIEKYTLFLNQDKLDLLFQACIWGESDFFPLQFNMYCSVVFMYDWSLYVTGINYWKTNHTDQNSQGWEHSGWAVNKSWQYDNVSGLGTLWTVSYFR